MSTFILYCYFVVWCTRLADNEKLNPNKYQSNAWIWENGQWTKEASMLINPLFNYKQPSEK